MLTGEKLGRAIEQAIKKSGMKKAELARQLQVSPQSVQGWIKTGRISKETFPKLVRLMAPYVSDDHWGTEKSFFSVIYQVPEKRDSNVGIAEAKQGYKYNQVPVISWVQAGALCDPVDPYQPGDADEWLPCPSNHSPTTYALRVQGDSMTSQHPGQRSYPDGIIIFVDPEKQPENGSRVIAKVDSQVTFKVFQQDMGRVFLRPINQAYPTIEVKAEDLHICGVVIGSYLPE